MEANSNHDYANQLPFDPVQIQLEDRTEVDPSDSNNKQYKQPIARFASDDWQLGWTDGRLGRPQQSREDQINAESRLDLANKAAAIRKELAGKKAALAGLLQKTDDLAGEIHLRRTAFEEMLAAKLKRAQEFSKPLGYTFVFVALLLWMADMPLTLRLVSQGLGIPTEYPPGNKPWLQVNDLFHSPVQVLVHLWEPLFLALGLSLMPMMAKLFLEEYFFRKPDQPPLMRRRFWLFTFSAVLLVVTLGALGVFRSHQFERGAEKKAQATAAAIKHAAEEWGVSPAPTPTPAPSPTPAQNTPKPVETELLTSVTFILLTITLSLAGAILFSSGWDRLSQSHNFKQIQTRLTNCQKEYREACEKKTDLEGQISYIETVTLPFVQSPGYLSDCVTYRVKTYQHGYERGYAVPETLHHEDNLYKRCQRIIIKQLADKLRTA